MVRGSKSPSSGQTSPHHESAGMQPKPLDRTESETRHQDYLDSLPVPTLEKIEDIAKVQEEKEKEIEKKYKDGRSSEGIEPADSKQLDKAASTIQVRLVTVFQATSDSRD